MAIVTDEMVTDEEVDTKPVRLAMPDFNDADGMVAFAQEVNSMANLHGQTILLANIKRYVDHNSLASKSRDKIIASVNRINGYRNEAQKAGDSKRGITRAVRKVYGAYDEDTLKAQLKIAKIKPSDYRDRESALDALVVWHQNMVKQSEDNSNDE